ncbi:MAG: 4-(cytidine 5'-diphospho)-2-C-methyl-D-erythritol kinase [Candidatus Aminicenantes bacterium RBG_13_63_10]|nr:MAG: 4-(cytidine 5'-diphospho)-2-C-methyl-D-erythritol kinase [Candidatus Aminicenantes bacterium RBG_13_63_10]
MIKSFAKINLGLEVLGRRPDGFHDIRTLFQSVSLHDDLFFFPDEAGRILVSGDDPEVPWDESNLIHRAARALSARRPGAPGVRVEVRKRIPSGKGLGGGSGNAAMTLRALNRLWGLGLDRAALADIGRGLGADVPYFFEGGLCLGEERGDRISPLEDLPSLPLVIVLPPFSCPTAEIYRSHRLRPAPEAKLTSSGEDSRIMRFFETRELRSLENSLEATVFRFHPRLQDLKALLLSRGAELSLVTGSGSAVFGLFRDRRRAEEARRLAEEVFPAILAETVSREQYGRDIRAGV